MEQNLNQNMNNNNVNNNNFAKQQPEQYNQSSTMNAQRSLDEASIISNQGSNSSDDKARIVTVEVPVAVPVEVPVAVPVYVPILVYAPDSTTIEQQLKEQEVQQLSSNQPSLPQTSDYIPLSSDINKNENNNNANNNKMFQTTDIQDNLPSEEDLLSVNFTEITNNIKENLNIGMEKASNTLNSIIETGKNQLGLSKQEQKPEQEVTELAKPKSAIFSEAKQPLVSQALEEEDKKSVSDTYITPTVRENELINNDFEINELHDIKKEHKNIPLNKENQKNSFNNLMDKAKETLNDGMETIKNNLGFNGNNNKSEDRLFSQEKQPLMTQPLEEEDKQIFHNFDTNINSNSNSNSNSNNNFEVNELHDIKKEHKEKTNIDSESRFNNIINETNDIVNNSVETFKDTLGFNNKNSNIVKNDLEEEKPLMRQPVENEDKQIINNNNNNNNDSLNNNKEDVTITSDKENLIYEQPIILQGNARDSIGRLEKNNETSNERSAINNDHESDKIVGDEIKRSNAFNNNNSEMLENKLKNREVDNTKEMDSF